MGKAVVVCGALLSLACNSQLGAQIAVPTTQQKADLGNGIRWLGLALRQVCNPDPPTQAPLASAKQKQCLKEAHIAIRKVFWGKLKLNPQGGPALPETRMFVYNPARFLEAQTSAESTNKGPNGEVQTSSSPRVMGGDEATAFSVGCFAGGPWIWCSIMAHEGKRQIETYDMADERKPTKPELKVFYCNEEKAYDADVTCFAGVINELEKQKANPARTQAQKDSIDKLIGDVKKLKKQRETLRDAAKKKKEALGG